MQAIVVSSLLFTGFYCTIVDDGTIPITTSSNDAKEYYLQGRELVEKLRSQEAIYFFLQALAKDPNFAIANLNMALAQPSAKGFFKYLNKARALVDEVSEGERLWILGVEAGANADPMKQRELYQKMVDAYPLDERARNILGNHYFIQQEYQLAIEEYNKTIEINPNFSQPYNQLGYSHRYLGNYGEAENAFKKYIDLIPGEPNPYDSYAELLLKMGKYDSSIEYYKKALSINPNFYPSHIGIASNLVLGGKHKDARKQLQVLYDNALNNGQRRHALYAKAVSYIDEGDLEKALDEINMQYFLADIIEDVAAMAEDLSIMGNILLEAGKVSEAMTKYREALMIVEESELSQEIKNNIKHKFLYIESRVALIKGDFPTAETKSKEYSNQAQVNNNPYQIRLSHELSGMIALKEKDYDKAIEELQNANQQNPYNLFRIAQAFEGKGDIVKAEEFYMKIVDFNPLNSLNHAFIRNKTVQKLTSIQGG